MASHDPARPLYALLLASILVPGLACIGAGWVSWRQLRAEAENRALTTVSMLHEHAQKVFEINEVMLDWLDQRLQRLSWAEIAASPVVHQDMMRVKGTSRQISSMLVVDPAGRMVANTRRFPLEGPVDMAERDFFLAARDNIGKAYVGAPVVGHLSQLPILNIGRARSSPDGQFNGVIAVAVLTSYFTDFYGKVLQSPRDSVALIRADGSMLARVPDVAGMPARLGPSVPLMQQIGKTDRGVYRAVSAIDGVERLYAYRRVGDLPVYVSCGLDLRAFRQIWYRNLALFCFFALLAAAGLFSVALLALRRTRREQAVLAALAAEVKRREGVEAQLLQAQRMEAIGQMTGGVAHDFNNLLQALNGCLEMVERRVQDPQVTGLVRAGIDTVERGARLVRHLLAFARRQPLAPEAVDLASRIRGMRDLLDRSLRTDIRVDLDLPADLWPLLADPIQLELAILNLAVNARDAMPQGGLLRLSAANVTLTPGDQPDGLDGEAADGLMGDFVRLTVTDTGTGMPPEVQARAFEPFYTTKEVGQGSGMGLSMVYGFVRQSGGGVQLSSRPGSGTSVVLLLPRSPRPPEPSLAEAPAATRPGNSGTVLLVEDDAAVGIAVEDMLAAAGHQVHRVLSGTAALSVLDQRRPVDLVLSDVMMPGGLTGLDLAREIRRTRPDLPVILMTGFSTAIAEAEAEGLTVLAKPCRAETLLRTVADMLDRRGGTPPHQPPRAPRSGGPAPV
ncbi:hybrid sensor histidine kinase/response regulator [Oleisolibacter albus]|uniref:hybrid sensor histidine kinase/response regulator n=1 Tax=Oleisolibacter albus TaxID=2171757 RepID=UPI0013901622|nr:hybrid sensor histidine kinase/response regulator [Oleisolibacter albus]